jgi:hypothetical protein
MGQASDMHFQAGDHLCRSELYRKVENARQRKSSSQICNNHPGMRGDDFLHDKAEVAGYIHSLGTHVVLSIHSTGVEFAATAH